MEGRVPAERMASSGLTREFAQVLEATLAARQLDIDVVLPPLGGASDEMVPVPGGSYELSSPDAPTGLSVELDDFYIDRFEVTNEAFRAFVLGGGYAADILWQGVPEDVRARLVDRTGLPGPRGWSGQSFAEGAYRHPVTGVTWYEAAAFCRSLGKRLPTVYEWEKTARDGAIARRGVMMPWGWVGSASGGAGRANFSSSGPTDVDAFPFGISPYGAYGMGGNAREWLANRFGEGVAVAGGAWDGPSYLYSNYGSQPAEFSAVSLGFRCARSEGPGHQGGGDIDLDLREPIYTPVDDDGFRALLAHYRYDRRPANPRLTETVETDSWIRQRLWIDGIQGDSVLLYFYAPKSASPPYQTIVYVPGVTVFYVRRLPEEAEWMIGPVIQAGRAVLTVVLEGMIERGFPPGFSMPEPSSVAFRDLMVRHATELRLGIDYIETRPDVDTTRIAYIGSSFGAGSRLGFSAVDDRYDAVVYLAAGIDERMRPTLPETDNVNFAPYVTAPKLVVNGRSDEEHPWVTRGLPLWNLLREPKELVLVDGGGHIVPLEARIPAINDFLDRTLGPVRR
jgi:formylglycine-generating enzyme required for sulfatase activity/pimeloyl-ACP methyl ester carboxylesterase